MSNLAYVINGPKGATEAKLDGIRSIVGHLLTVFVKTAYFGNSQFGPEKCLKLKNKKMLRPNPSREGMNQLLSIGVFH